MKNLEILKNTDELIYQLIFSVENDFTIDISSYIDDIYQYNDFISNIKYVLKKSKVKIVKSEIKLDSKTVIWKLKVNK